MIGIALTRVTALSDRDSAQYLRLLASLSSWIHLELRPAPSLPGP